jgi:lysophospholipase L1-like esterase
MKHCAHVSMFIAAMAYLGIGCASPDDGSGGSAGSTAGVGGAVATGTGGASSIGGTGAGGGVGGSGTGGAHDAGAAAGAPGTDAGRMDGAGTGGRNGGAGGASSADGSAGGAAGAPGAFDPCPTNGTPCKILPLGDSITFGIQFEGAYRVELFSKAVSANKKITFVGSQMNGPTTVSGMTFPRSHEGHSGFTIDQMVPFVASDAQYAPNIILLHIGTNDTYMSNPGGAPTRLQSLVDMILTAYPNTLLVVAKIVPYPSQMANVNTFNATIPGLVASRAAMGKHILLADLNTGFNVPTMLSSDTIHPNQTGYNFMGDTWYSVIGSYLH